MWRQVEYDGGLRPIERHPPMKQPSSFLRPTSFLAMFLAGLVTFSGLLVVVVMPLFISSFAASGLDSELSGEIVAINPFAIAIAMAITPWLLQHISLFKLVVVGCVLSFAGAGIGYQIADVSNTTVMMAVMAIMGLGNGLVSSAGYAWGAQNPHSEKCFGVFLAIQFVMGGLSFMFFYVYMADPDSFQLLMKLCIAAYAVSLLLSPILAINPNPALQEAQAADTPSITSVLFNVPVLAALLAYGAFLVANGGIWGFIEQLGVDWEFAVAFIGDSLTYGSFIGLLGAGAVYLLSTRLGHVVPIAVGCIASAVSITILVTSPPDETLYMGTILVINFFWGYTAPYIQSILADLDPHGRAVVFSAVVATLGLSIGPAMFGKGYATIGFANTALMVAGLFIVVIALVLPGARANRKTAQVPAKVP